MNNNNTHKVCVLLYVTYLLIFHYFHNCPLFKTNLARFFIITISSLPVNHHVADHLSICPCKCGLHYSPNCGNRRLHWIQHRESCFRQTYTVQQSVYMIPQIIMSVLANHVYLLKQTPFKKPVWNVSRTMLS